MGNVLKRCFSSTVLFFVTAFGFTFLGAAQEAEAKRKRPGVFKVCSKAIKKHCKRAGKSRRKALRCLKKKRSKLRGKCKSAVAKLKRRKVKKGKNGKKSTAASRSSGESKTMKRPNSKTTTMKRPASKTTTMKRPTSKSGKSLLAVCKADRKKFCKRSRLAPMAVACLMKNRSKLSGACREAFSKLKKKKSGNTATILRSGGVSANAATKLEEEDEAQNGGDPATIRKSKSSLPSLNQEIIANGKRIPKTPYCWKGLSQYKGKCERKDGKNPTGLSKTIRLTSAGGDWTVVKDGYGNSFCSAITYESVAPIVEEKGWLKKKSFSTVQTFQQLWYVVCPEGVQKSDGLHCKHPDGSVYSLAKIKREAAVLAAVHSGIGKYVERKDARRGDVVQLYRGSRKADYDRRAKGGYGHSVIFVGWVDAQGNVSENYDSDTVGIRYFSSQPSTNGVGEANECFVPKSGQSCPKAACGSCKLTSESITIGRLTGPNH